MVGKPPANSLYFYPRSPCGERPRSAGPWQGECKISIHALLAESDADVVSVQHGRQNFYPRSPCGERHGRINDISRLMKISIHALLAESDTGGKIQHPRQVLFLSTLSLRRATLSDLRASL